MPLASTTGYAIRKSDSLLRFLRSGFAALLFMVLVPEVTQAQAVPRGEIFFGIPFLRWETRSVATLGRANVNWQILGVEVSGGANLNRWFGISAQFDWHWGEVLYEHSLHTLLAGPVLSHGLGSRSRVFVHALLGEATSGCGEFGERGCQSASVFANAFGGGIDIGKRRALRLSVDAVQTHFHGDTQNFLRLSVGVRFPIGRRQ